MKPGEVRTIRAVGDIAPEYVAPSGAPLGKLIGKEATVIGHSVTYNSSVVVDVEGRVYDIHDQYLIP